MSQLEFNNQECGNMLLSERVFTDVSFANMVLVPKHGRLIELSNIEFQNCRVTPGTCVISEGVKLKNVKFASFECGDALRISSEAMLERVVISGKCPSALIIKPENKEFATREHSADFQLDISEYFGRVSIIGLHGGSIRKDPLRHVAVKLSWKNAVDWKSLGIGPSSFWWILLKILEASSATEGVFSLPPKSDKRYSRTINEMDALKKSGLRIQV